MHPQVVAKLKGGRNEKYPDPDQRRQPAAGPLGHQIPRRTAGQHPQSRTHLHVGHHEYDRQHDHPGLGIPVGGTDLGTAENAARSDHDAGSDQAGSNTAIPGTIDRRGNGGRRRFTTARHQHTCLVKNHAGCERALTDGGNQPAAPHPVGAQPWPLRSSRDIRRQTQSVSTLLKNMEAGGHTRPP